MVSTFPHSQTATWQTYSEYSTHTSQRRQRTSKPNLHAYPAPKRRPKRRGHDRIHPHTRDSERTHNEGGTECVARTRDFCIRHRGRVSQGKPSLAGSLVSVNALRRSGDIALEGLDPILFAPGKVRSDERPRGAMEEAGHTREASGERRPQEHNTALAVIEEFEDAMCTPPIVRTHSKQPVSRCCDVDVGDVVGE
ncbi:hypothetical protein P154DRAFT_573783 [Amniculicola lignicola CBS 123094]|uniref:Uncharacterized protein n=1 Tax=Amniculicola lignicola CBS 123094 TaxID=1392246 RepID=A0A6A5WLJ1_9PLEO|nr:hypothetical protein P154DRAFT_573783 [Amniculicola lignicola CBS 123094]